MNEFIEQLNSNVVEFKRKSDVVDNDLKLLRLYIMDKWKNVKLPSVLKEIKKTCY